MQRRWNPKANCYYYCQDYCPVLRERERERSFSGRPPSVLVYYNALYPTTSQERSYSKVTTYSKCAV